MVRKTGCAHLELQFTKQLSYAVIGLGCAGAIEVTAELQQGRVQEQVFLHFRKARSPDRQCRSWWRLEAGLTSGPTVTWVTS